MSWLDDVLAQVVQIRPGDRWGDPSRNILEIGQEVIDRAMEQAAAGVKPMITEPPPVLKGFLKPAHDEER